MTTTILQPVDFVDKVADKQRNYDLVKTLLVLAMAIPFAVGWLAGKLVILLWIVASWLWAAVVVGWQTARPNTTDTPGASDTRGT